MVRSYHSQLPKLQVCNFQARRNGGKAHFWHELRRIGLPYAPFNFKHKMKIYITDRQTYDRHPLGEVNSVYGYFWEGWLCKPFKDGVLMYDCPESRLDSQLKNKEISRI